MAYTPKTWLNRPLEPNAGETIEEYETRLADYAAANPGLVTPMDAAGLNNLEGRIDSEFALVDDRFEDVDDALEALASTGPQTLSTEVSVFDATALPTSGSHSFVWAFELPYRASLLRVRVRMQGNGPGGTGTQPAKAVAYQGAGTGGLPTAPLLGVGPPVTLTNPAAAAVYEFEYADGVIGPAGDVSVGVHFSLSGSVNQAMTILVGNAAANSTLTNDDLYEDGTKTPFGTLTAGYSRLAFVELDIEPAPLDFTSDIAALEADVAALEAADTAIDVRLDDLEAGGDDEDGGAGAVVTVFTATLGSADIWTIDPLDLVGGGAAHATAFATNAGSFSPSTLHGTAWRAGVPVPTPVSQLATAGAATADEQVRFTHVNGGSASDVELTVTRVTA